MKLFIRHLIIFGIITAYALAMCYSGIGCPFKFLTHYPCPACGMTRAFIALIKFDFETSFHYHPMLLPMLIILPPAIHAKRFKRIKKTIEVLAALTSVVVFVTYIVRVFILKVNFI